MMNTIYWHSADISDVPDHNEWLSENESEILKKLRFEKRNREWRSGRWVVKNAVSLIYNLEQKTPFSEIEILSKQSGAPVLYLQKKTGNLSLSISHRAEKVVCVLSKDLKYIGCDLELIEPRSAAFVEDYFTQDEKELIGCSKKENTGLLANLIWSAKESALKALEVGLNMDTREINVSNIVIDDQPGWKNISIAVDKDTFYNAKWLQQKEYIITIASPEHFNLLGPIA